MSGQLTPQDVQLDGFETTDSEEYLERTLPNLLKLAYQKRAENNASLILSVVELSKLDALRGLNKFLIEP